MKTKNRFKNVVITSAIVLCSLGLHAQNTGSNGVTQWKTTGNMVDSNQFIGSQNNWPVIFKSDDTERLRITPDGNVGIGTVNPSKRLHVNGQMQVDSSMRVLEETTLERDLIVEGQLFVPNMDTALNDLSNFGFTFLDGYGQFKKAEYKDVLGALAVDMYDPILTDCELAGVYPKWNNGPDKLYTGCPNTNVGIRTDTPLHALDVNGNSYLRGLSGFGIEPQGGNQLTISTQQSNGLVLNYQSAASNGYGFRANVSNATTRALGVYNTQCGKDIFTVFGDGKIEVSNATGKIWQLDANGLMRGRQIKLDLDTWADYVFEDSYELMPLNEVENYIEQNRHLPNVPSETEILEEGVDLGEMNRVLLEKVEELTLYLIDQNKKVESLENELEALRNAVGSTKESDQKVGSNN